MFWFHQWKYSPSVERPITAQHGFNMQEFVCLECLCSPGLVNWHIHVSSRESSLQEDMYSPVFMQDLQPLWVTQVSLVADSLATFPPGVGACSLQMCQHLTSHSWGLA